MRFRKYLLVGVIGIVGFSQGSLRAMEAPDVQITVANDSTETLYVQVYEYSKGYFTGTYTDVSNVVSIEPGSSESINVDPHSNNERYLYYHTTDSITPSELKTYRQVPKDLNEDYALGFTTLRVTNTGDQPGFVQVFDFAPGIIKGTYWPQSQSSPIRPQEAIDVTIPAEASQVERYLFFGINESMNSYVKIPEQLTASGYDVSVSVETPVGERAAAAIEQYNEKYSQEVDLKWARSGAPELIEQEQEFLVNREKVTKPAIQKILNDQGYTRERYPEIDGWKMPRVALCTSGGGFRAMLASLGFVQGLSETGVLDTATYGAALSGSTWMWTKWLHDGATPEVLPDVGKEIRESLSKGLLAPEILNKSIQDKLLFLVKQQMYEDQIPISPQFKGRFVAESTEVKPSIINLYGMLLAEALFPNDPERYSMTFSSLSDRALLGSMPLPLCTAISSRELGPFEKMSKYGHPTDYSWFEFSPFSAGILESTSFTGNGYVPMWSLGRRYEKGYLGGVTSVKDPKWAFNTKVQNYLNEKTNYYAIEPAVNQLLGAFGSAFTVDPNALKRMGTIPVGAGSSGFFSGLRINNFFDPKDKTEKRFLRIAGIENLYESYKVNDNPFELRDAGMAFNLPLPPLFNPHRDINVVIILDSTGDLNKDLGGALKEFVVYAKHYGVKIPDTLEHEETLTRAIDEMKEFGSKIRVFGDRNRKDEMTVIYIPTIKDDTLPQEVRDTDPMKFSTFKLHYTPEETQELVSYSNALTKHHAKFIKGIIAQKALSINQ